MKLFSFAAIVLSLISLASLSQAEKKWWKEFKSIRMPQTKVGETITFYQGDLGLGCQPDYESTFTIVDIGIKEGNTAKISREYADIEYDSFESTSDDPCESGQVYRVSYNAINRLKYKTESIESEIELANKAFDGADRYKDKRRDIEFSKGDLAQLQLLEGSYDDVIYAYLVNRLQEDKSWIAKYPGDGCSIRPGAIVRILGFDRANKRALVQTESLIKRSQYPYNSPEESRPFVYYSGLGENDCGQGAEYFVSISKLNPNTGRYGRALTNLSLADFFTGGSCQSAQAKVKKIVKQNKSRPGCGSGGGEEFIGDNFSSAVISNTGGFSMKVQDVYLTTFPQARLDKEGAKVALGAEGVYSNQRSDDRNSYSVNDEFELKYRFEKTAQGIELQGHIESSTVYDFTKSESPQCNFTVEYSVDFKCSKNQEDVLNL